MKKVIVPFALEQGLFLVFCQKYTIIPVIVQAF
jgi:hypothetical protein